VQRKESARRPFEADIQLRPRRLRAQQLEPCRSAGPRLHDYSIPQTTGPAASPSCVQASWATYHPELGCHKLSSSSSRSSCNRCRPQNLLPLGSASVHSESWAHQHRPHFTASRRSPPHPHLSLIRMVPSAVVCTFNVCLFTFERRWGAADVDDTTSAAMPHMNGFTSRERMSGARFGGSRRRKMLCYRSACLRKIEEESMKPSATNKQEQWTAWIWIWRWINSILNGPRNISKQAHDDFFSIFFTSVFSQRQQILTHRVLTY